MNTLEALKATIEFQYTNDNLFTKVLTDRDMTGAETYTKTDYQKKVDLACADLYLYLASHPDLKEGGLSLTWSKKQLLAARRKLFNKYGIEPPEISSRPGSINGTRVW